MTQGHMIPMTDLALLLADRGVLVSLITTPCKRSTHQGHHSPGSGLRPSHPHVLLHPPVHLQHLVFDRIADEHQPFTVPGLREKIEVTRAQASEFFPGPTFENIAKDVREAEIAADGIVVNSFRDLEDAYIEGYQEATGKTVWTTGPLFLRSRSVGDMAIRGRKASIDVDHCLSWLGTM
ncbi:hypothetical protein GW17_00039516 [Ensete ventricosum]|nr:hypothetical protein GW17_00039516 [Ensete ventricosum]